MTCLVCKFKEVEVGQIYCSVECARLNRLHGVLVEIKHALTRLDGGIR